MGPRGYAPIAVLCKGEKSTQAAVRGLLLSATHPLCHLLQTPRTPHEQEHEYMWGTKEKGQVSSAGKVKGSSEIAV